MLTPPEVALVRRDPAIPGLATVLDPDAFLAALRRSVPGTESRAAQITFMRYRPGKSCLVAYRLQVNGNTVEVYGKAYQGRADDKLRRAREQSTVSGPLGPGHFVLEDCAVLILVFPNDPKLHALCHIEDAQADRDFLRELLPDLPDYWEGTVVPLRYRPERHYVAQLAGARDLAVLKFYAERGYAAARTNARAFQSRGPLRVARMLGSQDLHHVLALEWLPGRLLEQALQDPDFDCGRIATVSAALAELHAQNPDGLAYRSREVEAARLLAAADSLSFVCPHLASRAQALARRLAVLLTQEPPVRQPIHGDFSARQVVLAEDCVALIDFDDAVQGDPGADLGTFIGRLERNVLRGDLAPAMLESVRQALLESYWAATCGGTFGTCRHRISLYVARELLRSASHSFEKREPNWPDRMETLLERAEAVLAI